MSRHVAHNEAAVFRVVANGCPSIVQCYDVIEADDPVGHQQLTALVLEYCPGGDLFDLLAYRHHEVTMVEAARIAWQVCSAVSFLHDRNVVHRDLKLENILLMSRTAPFNLKLSDFGLARHLANADDRITSRCGSEEYTAPEVIMLSDSPYAPKPADMWSVASSCLPSWWANSPFRKNHATWWLWKTLPLYPT
ncbi:kinase-like domain-containing protein, partial [Catenaria anguillulae PL171]